jgi:hypothetical protein
MILLGLSKSECGILYLHGGVQEGETGERVSYGRLWVAKDVLLSDRVSYVISWSKE